MRRIIMGIAPFSDWVRSGLPRPLNYSRRNRSAPVGLSGAAAAERSVLGHELGPLLVLWAQGLALVLAALDAEAAVELGLGEVGPGGLGVALDDELQQALGLGVLLGRLGRGGLAVP